MGKRSSDKPGQSSSQQKRAKRFQPMTDRFKNSQSVFEISPGMKGIFATCNRHKEKKSAHETIDLLEEYASKLYPGIEDEIMNDGEEDEDADADEKPDAPKVDIEDEIAREVAGMKSKWKPKLFRYYNTMIDCLIFIKCHRKIDPGKLVQFIFDDLTKTMQRKTRFTGRIVPAQVTTTSKLDAIVKGATEVASELLAEDAEPSTFALVVNIRYCDALKRDDVIPAVAAPLDAKHKVDLKNAKYTIVIEAFKSMCIIGLVEDFNARRRLNLQTLFDEPEAKKTESKVEETVAETAVEVASESAAEAVAETVSEEPKDAVAAIAKAEN
ncbi:hypothetical protein BX661DRAFT_178931 [Kickxella alabastrina]|uniref:uncharacterized protein n=1 Tax=Kickxella alabastrina TaxID=61397 RepID=UPI00221F65F2|nr:uncharacterized protein BX661DRAFT_178931 [Kickxella alabastrina]KAI7832997.1 hypothetical protein BX661DRAFT_178931 [Kickxella alabastrina]